MTTRARRLAARRRDIAWFIGCAIPGCTNLASYAARAQVDGYRKGLPMCCQCVWNTAAWMNARPYGHVLDVIPLF